jgi:SAM-dependent methyltransferase
VTVDPVEYRQESRERWSRAARGWAAQAGWMQGWAMPVSLWMVDAIRPQPGQTVLELAAGPGDTGLLAAELIRPGGTLISTDAVEPMLAVARERAAALGADNVETRLVDAEWIDLPTASIDAVLCRWGYMLLVDPAAGLRETRRVLRPGGRVALAAWDAPERNPWAAAPAFALIARGLMPAPAHGDPGMFAFAQPGRIETLLGDAGFAEPVVDAVDVELSYADLDHYWRVSLDCSRPFADALAAMEEPERDALRAEVSDKLAAFRRPDGGYRVPGRTLVAAATA